MAAARNSFEQSVIDSRVAPDAQECTRTQQALQQDIIARQRAEAALQQSEARFGTVMQQSLQGVCIYQGGIVQFANPAMARIFGFTASEELLGRDFCTLVAPSERAHLDQSGQLYLCGDPAPSHCELQGVRRDGALLWLEVMTALTSWEGAPAVLVMCLDLTERRRLEGQVRQAQRMEAIGTLAGGIAHDFNNMLAAILGYTELAMGDVPPDSLTRSQLQRVLTAGERAKELVRQILTFSRQSKPERCPVDLCVIVKEVLRLLRASLPATIAIHQHCETKSAVVLADPTQMHQVLINLCVNAEHAMRTTGGVLEVCLEEVEVTAEIVAALPTLSVGPHVRLSVRDTGHGIAPDILDRIFDPFFTTKRAEEGTGMGLAVVQSIAVSHKGAVRVESTPGQGATFAVYLPQFRQSATATASFEEQLPGGTERILFVDDEEPLARLGRAMLERLGYEVVVSTNSLEALEVFRTAPQRFDLVITDYTMPGMTGEVLARALRRLRSDIPIILCTGFSHIMDAEKAHALGIDAFLLKPLLLRDLGLAIRRVLERQPTKRN
jgi:PAS domain S-box-containing protein